MTLGLDDHDLAACVACGLCLPHCPTYRVTGLETASPRGRIAAMRAVEWDGTPLDAAFERYMEECVQCRGCEAACPSSVPFGRLMERTREALEYQRRPARPWQRRVAERLAYTVVLPRHGLLLALTWLMLVGQRLHVVPSRFSLPRLSARSLATPLRPSTSNTRDADVWLFPGCVMDAWQRDVHRAAQRVVESTGARVALPGRGADCCGALHTHAGRVEEARALARRVIASMPGDAPIVVDSAGCGAAMKDYAHLLGTDEARTFAARIRDFGEWANEHDVRLRATGGAVVVQDPCHLRHVQRAAQPTHEVLARAYDVTTPDDDGLCCGAGGAYTVMQPTLSRAIRDRKVEALRADRAGTPLVVASANPGCIMQLRSAGIDARHPAELLADALVPDEGAR